MRTLLLLATLSAVAGFVGISWKRTTPGDSTFTFRFDFAMVGGDIQTSDHVLNGGDGLAVGDTIYVGTAYFYQSDRTTAIGDPVQLVATTTATFENSWYFEAYAEYNFTGLTDDTYVNFIGACGGDTCTSDPCSGADWKPSDGYAIQYVDDEQGGVITLWAFANAIDDYSPITFGVPEIIFDPTGVTQYYWFPAISGQGRSLNYSWAPTSDSTIAVGIKGSNNDYELLPNGNFSYSTTCKDMDHAFVLMVADGFGDPSSFTVKSWTEVAHQIYADENCQLAEYGGVPVVVMANQDCSSLPINSVPYECTAPLPVWDFTVGTSGSYEVAATQITSGTNSPAHTMFIWSSAIPEGATLTSTTAFNPTATLTWTPKATDRNQYVCFIADQNGGTLSPGSFCVLLNVFNVPIGSTAVNVDSTSANLPAGDQIIATASPQEDVDAFFSTINGIVVAFQLLRQDANGNPISGFLPDSGSAFVSLSNTAFTQDQPIIVWRWDPDTSAPVDSATDCAGHAVANVFSAPDTWTVQLCHTSSYVAANGTAADDADDKDDKDVKQKVPTKDAKNPADPKAKIPSANKDAKTAAKDAKADSKAGKDDGKAKAAIGAGVGAGVAVAAAAGGYVAWKKKKAAKTPKTDRARGPVVGATPTTLSV